MKDYCKILDVASDAGTGSIKKAFRDQVLLVHPEKNKATNAKQQFTDLIEAYRIISNPDKRKVYDAISYQSNPNRPEIIQPEFQEEFEAYEEDAKKTSKKYEDHSWEEFLVLELFLDTGIESLFSGGIDLLDDAEDLIGDIFDIF